MDNAIIRPLFRSATLAHSPTPNEATPKHLTAAILAEQFHAAKRNSRLLKEARNSEQRKINTELHDVQRYIERKIRSVERYNPHTLFL